MTDIPPEIVRCTLGDFDAIYAIINDGAMAYKGIIPPDRWHDPYMPKEELNKQIDAGVEFWKYTEGENILGVMGIQYKGDVTLIRHAYVRSSARNKGIGGRLLKHLQTMTTTAVLIGTWEAADWAIAFYQKHGFRLLDKVEKNELLRKYWSIPDRQVDTSVVLADKNW